MGTNISVRRQGHWHVERGRGLVINDNADGREGPPKSANDTPSEVDRRTRDEITTRWKYKLQVADGNTEETTQTNEWV
jgi:hypothetical protein